MELKIDASKSRVFNDLADYTQLPRALLLNRCNYAVNELALLWYSKKDTLDFYKSSDFYIYDLTKYQLLLEGNGRIKKMIEQIKELGFKKILEYGGGIGEFSIFCSENDLDVTYYDLNGKIKDYALWRFNKHNCNIKIGNSDVLDEKWDIVNIMDVLEHLENPEKVISKLKANATYIFCNPAEVKYNRYFPQHTSKFDLTKDFEHIEQYLWKNKSIS